ncbi:MAG: hypothetical protein KGM42_11495 [Hyphomicrobiales bacterium]|nr:hypothetical protein [Hyphomicrobiales bacterium]
MHSHEFVLRAEIETTELEQWVSEGWLLPSGEHEARAFTEIDLARACFIRDMRGIGVNDEGMPIVLDLVDQIHALRRMLRLVSAGVRSEPN